MLNEEKPQFAIDLVKKAEQFCYENGLRCDLEACHIIPYIGLGNYLMVIIDKNEGLAEFKGGVDNFCMIYEEDFDMFKEMNPNACRIN